MSPHDAQVLPEPTIEPDAAAPSKIHAQVVSSTGWLAIGYGARNVVTLASGAVLAHILGPHAFGVVAFVLPLMLALGALQDAGIQSALIYEEAPSEGVLASALCYYAVSATLIAVAMIALADPIAQLLGGGAEVAAVIRAMSVVPVARALSAVPAALIERDLGFPIIAKADVAGAVAQAGLAFCLAIAGAGYWSLVAGQWGAAIAPLLVFWVTCHWRPRIFLARASVLRDLSRYSRHIALGNIATLIYTSIDNVLVGRIAGVVPLGFYSQSYRLSQTPPTVIGYVIGRAMFPAYARVRNDLREVRELFAANLERLIVLAVPPGLFLTIAAQPTVVALLGRKWAPAAPILMVLSMAGLTRTMTGAGGELLKGVGRPGLAAKLSVFPIFALVPGLIVGIEADGGVGAGWAVFSVTLVTGVTGLFFAFRVAELRWRPLLARCRRAIAGACAFGGCIEALTLLTSSLAPGPRLAILAGAAGFLYVLMIRFLAHSLVEPLLRKARRVRLGSAA